MKRKVDTQEVFRKIMRPKCFGTKLLCINLVCKHGADCKKTVKDRRWLRQAIVMKAEHERKVRYFEKKIRLLREKGVTLG